MLGLGVEVLLRREFVDVHAIQRPAVGGGDLVQFGLGFGEAHVQHGLSARDPIEQELQGQRGLAGSGHALDQVETVRREAAVEDGIEALDAGHYRRGHGGRSVHWFPCVRKKLHAAMDA